MKTAEDIIKEKNGKLITIDRNETVIKAIEIMVKMKIGAILVTDENNEIIGIWSERDHLRNTVRPDFDPRNAIIKDYMVSPVFHASHDDSLDKLQDMFLGLFIRHLPVKKNGENIGLISIGDVTRANLMEKDYKIKELHKIASWEYYENWGWHQKHE